MEPSRALLGCLASAAAAAPPGEDGAGAGAEEEEEEEEEAVAAPRELGCGAPLPYWMKAQHEGALSPSCISGNTRRFHTQLNKGPETP